MTSPTRTMNPAGMNPASMNPADLVASGGGAGFVGSARSQGGARVSRAEAADASTGRIAAQPSSYRPVPFLRLLAVEMRKMADTRAGVWLLAAIGLALAALTVTVFLWGAELRSFSNYLYTLAVPLTLLVPIVAILSATGEFSQRTALTTFAVEPRRARVVVAKAVASLIVGVLAYWLAVALAAAAHAASIAWRDTPAAWSLSGGAWVGLALVLAISVLQGAGFGLALLNTPLAITVFLVLPTGWTIITALVPRLVDIAPWIDLGAATEPLFEMSGMAGADWAHLASASAIWVLLPLAVGFLRVLRREIS